MPRANREFVLGDQHHGIAFQKIDQFISQHPYESQWGWRELVTWPSRIVFDHGVSIFSEMSYSTASTFEAAGSWSGKAAEETCKRSLQAVRIDRELDVDWLPT